MFTTEKHIVQEVKTIGFQQESTRKMIINSDARFAETRAYDDTHFFVRAMLAAEKFYAPFFLCLSRYLISGELTQEKINKFKQSIFKHMEEYLR